jgi:hypothetical protein
LNVPATQDRFPKPPVSLFNWTWVGLLAGGALAFVLTRAKVPPALFGALFAAAVGVAMLPCALGWKRTDEAAREAHKSAWFWGGAWSLAAMAGGFAWLFRAGPGLDLHRFALGNGGDAGLVAAGIALCVLVQIVGYGLCWAGWWLARR